LARRGLAPRHAGRPKDRPHDRPRPPRPPFALGPHSRPTWRICPEWVRRGDFTVHFTAEGWQAIRPTDLGRTCIGIRGPNGLSEHAIARTDRSGEQDSPGRLLSYRGRISGRVSHTLCGCIGRRVAMPTIDLEQVDRETSTLAISEIAAYLQ